MAWRLRRQAIIWTNAGLLSIGPLRTNFSEILIKIQQYSLKKMHLKMSSAKQRLCCLGPNVLNQTPTIHIHVDVVTVHHVWTTLHLLHLSKIEIGGLSNSMGTTCVLGLPGARQVQLSTDSWRHWKFPWKFSYLWPPRTRRWLLFGNLSYFHHQI